MFIHEQKSIEREREEIGRIKTSTKYIPEYKEKIRRRKDKKKRVKGVQKCLRWEGEMDTLLSRKINTNLKSETTPFPVC